jgi:FAD/FMN-containing dehydrogenase/Fe-S oxidoreductase
VPIGVVIPRDVDAVVRTIDVCRRYGAPVLSRGGGTSLAGQCCNVAVVIDMSKYLRGVVALDPQAKLARVQPGCVLDDLRAAAERHGLTFGPDPATHNHNTLGGMIGNDSCGVHSVMAGKTVDNVEELEILTYDGLRMRVGRTSEPELARIIAAGGRRGEIYAGMKRIRDRYADLIRARFPNIPRRVSGYNLDQLLPENGFHVARALVGTESTCVTVLEASLRLVHSPPARTLLVLGYPDVASAADHVPEIMDARPIGLEGFDERMVAAMKKKGLHPKDADLLPDGGGWLLVEFGDEMQASADGQARDLMRSLKQRPHPPSMKLFSDPAQEHLVWQVRESALGATAVVPGEPLTWPGWEDAAVPPDRLGDYLRDFRSLLDRYGYLCSFYGHFGQGCVHVRIDFDLTTHSGIQAFRSFVNDAADLVVSYGGSLSGEHGDGQARAELLPKMFGGELVRAFGEFKALWDPDDKMNPGKMVHPYRIEQNLRLGTDYRPPQPATHFKFPDDGQSFQRATLRCVGVGRCRREGGGTMCPSYMVTREEQHSTRGRARLLFEMLEGDPLQGGWKNESVREALDLCLACKGCKGDCPVSVDMATYKAEFLSHYYAGRLRPRSAYAFGLIMYWARLASLMQGAVNFVTQTPLLRDVAKITAGIAPQRRIPPFAGETFTHWFARHAPANPSGPRVILWPDTFNNHFFPQTARAAVQVLEAAGWRVTVPGRWLCCGRPLYDYGMLDRATALLHQILDALRPEIEAGVPVVGLEPSCVSVFRDELVNLLPDDEDAQRLSRQTYLLSEFLEQKAPGFQPPRLARKALVHGHCHHKAVLKMDAEERLLAKLGLDYTLLDDGCCGMAGAFGFEQGDHYDVSIKAGERALLPAVRGASQDTLVVADGFSCREQIAQTTDRRALHTAEVLRLALEQRGAGGPEATSAGEETNAERGARRITAAAVTAGLAAGLVAAGALSLRLRQE